MIAIEFCFTAHPKYAGIEWEVRYIWENENKFSSALFNNNAQNVIMLLLRE